MQFLRKQKDGKTWKAEWTFVPEEDVERLVSNSFCDMATMWTHNGFVYKIMADSEDKIEVVLFTVKQRYLHFFMSKSFRSEKRQHQNNSVLTFFKITERNG